MQGGNSQALGQLLQGMNLQNPGMYNRGQSPLQPGGIASRVLHPGQSPLMGGSPQMQNMGMQQMPPQMQSGAPSQFGYGGIIRGPTLGNPVQGQTPGINMGFTPR